VIRKLEALLDEILEVEFSFRNTADPAASIARLTPEQQRYVMEWVRRVASTNIELGYQYACHAVRALEAMETSLVEEWALHAMDTYDREGLRPAREIMLRLDDFVETRRQRISGSLLQENEGVLLGFLHGLSGRKLKIAPAEQATTDTETIFLPPLLARFETREQNFLFYKSAVAALWAQVRFGTFRLPLSEEIARQPDPERFLALFHGLETLRLEAVLARELPGLYRRIERQKRELGEAALPPEWDALRPSVAAAGVTAEWVMQRVLSLPEDLEPYPVPAYQGVLRPDLVDSCAAARLEREKAKLRVRLKMLEDELPNTSPQEEGGDEKSARRFSQQTVPDSLRPEEMRVEILLDGKPLPLPEDVQELVSSIIMDLGEIPDDYLEPAGPGEYDSALFHEQEEDPDDVWSGVYHEEGAHLYQEWDFQRKNYRKNWCAAREKSITPVYDRFVEETLEKYRGLVKHLRKTFEAMRDENRLLKQQTQGDDVDLDALVEALADSRDGREMSDRLFTRMHRSERNIAVIFMVDMSGSTKGWINDAERESLVLLCEALETLGDRYAIYGFSSITRKRCEIYHVKHFDEPYDREVKGRISGIQPKDYTRMGFAIRHLTRVLGEVEASTRVLITLSDGKPDDYDSYRGEYGIEDTRRALIEARREGIHPYCITIDEQARDYLPHLYGPAAYTVIDEVRALPLKVSDIYRRLTT